MLREIRIYIEGGGDGANTKALLRGGFSNFFSALQQSVREKKIKWNLTTCGSRNNTFRDFKNALQSHPEAFNILLVDSEGVVTKQPWEHLRTRDTWDSPNADDNQCHLMVQTMENWLVADIEVLEKFYGQNFKNNLIPRNTNVEEIDKDLLARKLKESTCNTSKGEYHKTKHAPKLLGQLNTEKVRNAASHCNELFNTLEKEIGVERK
jgi:Domain of unknown function (DUF4276)